MKRIKTRVGTRLGGQVKMKCGLCGRPSDELMPEESGRDFPMCDRCKAVVIRAIEEHGVGRRLCAICEATNTCYASMFIPNDKINKRMGGGVKRRCVVFALCAACLALPDWQARVKQSIVRDLAECQAAQRHEPT